MAGKVKCAKCGITPQVDPALTFHRFPLPSKQGSLKSKVWAKFCFPNDDWTSDESLQKLNAQHKMLCGNHFDDSSFTSSDRKRLNRFAIPTEAQTILTQLRDEQNNSFRESQETEVALFLVTKPKRNYSGDKEEKSKKLRKYQENLDQERHHSRRDFSSEDDQESPNRSPTPQSLISVVRAPCIVNSLEGKARHVTARSSLLHITPMGTTIHENSMTGVLSEAPQVTKASDVPSGDPELLAALGVFEVESNEWGRDISDDLAKRWESILRDGLKKEVKEELLKKWLFPKNCPLVKPPVLNPEISAMLNESARNRDASILNKQSQLACALTMLGRTMSDILTKSIDMPDILRNLADTTKIIANSHYLETETRRSLVTSMIDKNFMEPFKDRKRDSHLFGWTGKLIQSSVPSTNNLNSRRPRPRILSNYRVSRPQQNRGGGVKAQTYRRHPTAYTTTMTHTHRTSPPPSTSQCHKHAGTAKKKQ